MIRLLLALFIAFACTAHAAGQPQLRVQIEGRQPVLVGQQIRVTVQVLAPNFFMSPPQFPATLELPGAVVRLLDDRAANTTETIGGQSYAGIARSYAVTPQQAGEFTLPSVKIAFTYAAEPGKPGARGELALPPQKFTAALPAGTAAGTTTPVARVTLTQSLDRELTDLKAGDTLTRTIEAVAANTQPMMIPPPHFEAPAGARVYPQDPQLGDVTSPRGDFLGGRRVDRVTYAFDAAGDYVLPAVEVAWFDPASGKQEIARVPEIRVAVAPNPGWTPAIAPETPPAQPAPAVAEPRFDWRRWAPIGIGLVAALGLLWWLARRYGPRWRARSERRRRPRSESEAAYFAQLEAACRASDGAAAYRALAAWSRRIGAASIAGVAADAPFRAAVAELEGALFGRQRNASWNGRRLAAAARAARQAQPAYRLDAAEYALPPLNP